MNGVGGIGADSAALRWYVCCKHGNSLPFYPTKSKCMMIIMIVDNTYLITNLASTQF